MSKSLSAAAMRRARARLVRRLGRRGDLMKGSLVTRWTRCGRGGCACARGEKHGPYLYVSVFREGRTRSVYVPQHLEADVRQWVENAHALERDLVEISWLNSQLMHRQRESRRKGARGKAARRARDARRHSRPAQSRSC
jgi:hypothetical protein